MLPAKLIKIRISVVRAAPSAADYMKHLRQREGTRMERTPTPTNRRTMAIRSRAENTISRPNFLSDFVASFN
jgi:hypothetical protein